MYQWTYRYFSLTREVHHSIHDTTAFGKRRHEENAFASEDNGMYLPLLVKISSASIWKKWARAKTQLFRVPVGVSMSLQNIFLNNQVFVRWKPLVLWFWKTPGHYNGSIIGNQLILKTGLQIYTLFCLFPHEYLCAIILTGLSNFYVDIGFWPMGLGSAEMQHSCLATQTHQFIGGDEYFLRNIFFSLFLNR